MLFRRARIAQATQSPFLDPKPPRHKLARLVACPERIPRAPHRQGNQGRFPILGLPTLLAAKIRPAKVAVRPSPLKTAIGKRP
jgi:hypothetical protein